MQPTSRKAIEQTWVIVRQFIFDQTLQQVEWFVAGEHTIYFAVADRYPWKINPMFEEFKQFWATYSRYFVDVWQYLVIIVIFMVAALVIL